MLEAVGTMPGFGGSLTVSKSIGVSSWLATLQLLLLIPLEPFSQSPCSLSTVVSMCMLSWGLS